MSNDREAIRRIDWVESLPFIRLFRGWGLALHPTKLFLALMGVAATMLVGVSLDAMWPLHCESSYHPKWNGNVSRIIPGGENIFQMERGEFKPLGVFEWCTYHCQSSVASLVQAAVNLNAGQMVAEVQSFITGMTTIVGEHPWYMLVFGIIFLAIWSICGGAICRHAAMQAAREERIGPGESLRFARGRFGSFFAAPLAPWIAVLIIGLLLSLFSLFGAIPTIGDVAVGALFIIPLLAGFAMAFAVIGAVAGAGLTFPTIAVEATDAFEALSRSFSYVYQRPVKTVFYAFVSIVVAAVGLAFAQLFVQIMLSTAFYFTGLTVNWDHVEIAAATEGQTQSVPKLEAMWRAPEVGGSGSIYYGFDPGSKLSGAPWLGQWLLKCWIYLVRGAVAAYAVSLFFSLYTLMYFLLRRDVDDTDLEEVYVEEEWEATEESGPAEGAAPAGPRKTAGGVSLPVVGQ